MIDSDKNTYVVQHGVLIRLAFFSDAEAPLLVKGRVLFIPFSFRLDKLGRSKEKKKRKRKSPFKGNMARVFRALYRALHLRYLHVVLDTGSPIWNAILIPPAQMVNGMYEDRYSLHVSFSGRNYLAGRLDLRPSDFLIQLLFNRKT